MQRLTSGAALKTWSVLVFFLALKAAGNSWMAWGMKQVPERMSLNPWLYLHAMLNPFVALGIMSKSFTLVVVGGLFVLHQTFTGAVATINWLVAKSALVGTLINSQTMLLDATSDNRWKLTCTL